MSDRDHFVGQAIAHHQVRPQDDEEDRPERAEESELDPQQSGKDIMEIDGREPETVGVDVGQRTE